MNIPDFNSTTLFELADKAIKAGNYKEAIEAYHLVFALPELSEKTIELTCWGLGECHLNLRQYKEAEHFFKEAIKRNKSEPNYHYLLGVTYSNQAKSNLALKYLNKALELKPNDPEVIRCVGWATFFSGRKEEGLLLLKKSAKLDSTNPLTFCDLATAYLGGGKMSEAMVCAEEAKRLAPDHPLVKKVFADLTTFEKGFKALKQKGLIPPIINEPHPLENKILAGGKCVCDICGKKKKMGGFFDPRSPNPKIVCVDCMIKETAIEHRMTAKEAKRRRERMFASSNLFVKLKMEDYSKFKGREIDSIEEANKALVPIMEFWNNKFTTKQRKAFEIMNDEELAGIYAMAKIDFSNLLTTKAVKVGRNDPCPCGSGKKYKKCCGK